MPGGPIHLQGQHQAHPVWKKHCPGTKSRINRFSSIFIPSRGFNLRENYRQPSITLLAPDVSFPGKRPGRKQRLLRGHSIKIQTQKQYEEEAAETQLFLVVENKSQALNGKIFKHLNAHLRCTQGGQASLKELPAGHQLPPAAALVSFLPNLHLLSDANGPPCCSCKKVHSHQGSHHLNKQHFVRKQSQAEKAFVYCFGSSAKYWQHYKTLAALQNTDSITKHWQQCKILAAV